MVMRKIKCGKCNQKITLIREDWLTSIEFEVGINGDVDRVGEINPDGPTKVFAVCDCGHQWKLRGVDSVDQLKRDTSHN